MDARHAELVAKQVVIDLEPTDQTWGTREMYVRFERAGQPLVGYWIGRNYWGRALRLGRCRSFGEDKASSGAGDDEVEELVMRLDAP